MPISAVFSLKNQKNRSALGAASTPQGRNIKYIMVGQKYFKGRWQTYIWGGQKYTKYNKINNNFREARLLLGDLFNKGACLIGSR